MVLLYEYWLVVIEHGVFYPPFVNFRTTPYNAVIPSIPKHFVPNFRVVISLTTMPHQIEHLHQTLASLIDQIVEPDAIYLNLPQGKARTGDEYYVPQWLLDNNEKKYKNKLIILRCEHDYGPLTKLYPVLLKETNSSTLIITVDDDHIYPNNLVQTVAWYSYNHPNATWGDCGWSFQRVPHKVQVISVYVPYLMRGSGGRQVEVLQAVCGNGYRRFHFKNLSVLSNPTKECFTTDDLWISGYLQFSTHIPRVLIRENIEPTMPPWKKKKKDDSRALHVYNTKNAQDIKCINSIERLYNQTWLQ